MSGNPTTTPGGGSGGFGTGGGGGGDGCAFDFVASVGSPDPALVPQMRAGDVLMVALQDNPPAVLVTDGAGNVVGGITQFAAQLRSCIQQGYAYEAEVQSVRGGAVEVQVRPV
jgi:hypothetical protein